MKKKLLSFLMLLMCFFFSAFAQSKIVTGNVLDAERGLPIPGVSVKLIGTSRVTQTDSKGHYSLNIDQEGIIEFTYLGYLPQQIKTTDNNAVIRLLSDNQQLSEVVVTGYGNTTKKAFTGSASTITNEKFKDLQVTTITGVLQGNASGVMSVNTSGQPGESPSIRIRGIGSYNASNEPLIVLDGAPYSGNINSINPADVETITVLKDASSTSIYGSRAANGIIQIVTKRGEGKPKFTFSGITGFSERAVKEYETVDAGQYYELAWEALRNDAVTNPSLLTQLGATSPEEYATKTVVSRLVYNPFQQAEPVGLNGKINPGTNLLWDESYMDELIRTGIRTDLNFNVSGSDQSGSIRYYMSGGYIKDEGIIKESQFKRYTGRVKVDATPVKGLRFGVNSNLAYSDQNYPYQGSGAGSDALSFARTAAPIYSVYLRDLTTGEFILDATGNKIYDFGNNSSVLGVLRPTENFRPYIPGQNPAGTISINPITNEVLTANGIFYGELDLLKGLVFRTQYSLIYNQGTNNTIWNPFYGDGTTNGGLSSRSIANQFTQNFTNTLSYDTKIGEIHHLNVVAGAEAYKLKIENTEASRTGFTFAEPMQPSYGTIESSSGTVTERRLESYFARLGYDLAGKYHLSLSVRTDGSTRFAQDARWGVFYAIGTAWNINQEKFLKDVEFLSNLKLTASYGTSGNQELSGSFPYIGTYSAGWNMNGASGTIINTVANLDLTWEKQKQLDLGLEFGFLKDRITGSVGYFDRRSDHLLFERPLPGSTGITSISDNVGGVRNYGYEFDLSSTNINTKFFQWRTSLNITKLTNKITVAAPGTTQIVGNSWYDLLLREYAGVDAADGLPQWYMDDPNNAGEKIITKDYNSATRYYQGNRLSDYTGGITNFLRFKNFDLTVLASFGIGGYYYDNDYAGLMGGRFSGSTVSTDIYNRWQSPSNPGDGLTPKLGTDIQNATSSSTRFLYDASYLRVRNITLGYSLSEQSAKALRLSSARFFVDFQNGFTFFGGPKGSDPEAGINAQTSNNNSTANKVLALGINIGI